MIKRKFCINQLKILYFKVNPSFIYVIIYKGRIGEDMKDSLNEITSKRRNEIGEASTRVLNDRITESLRNNRFFNESK